MSQRPLLDLQAKMAPQWRDLAGRFEQADQAVDRAFYDMGQTWGARAARRLQAATPRRTGRTAESWRSDYVRSQRAVTVSNKRPSALYLLRGTRAHDIPHAFGRALPFGVGGRFMGMFHPGQQPDEHLVGALERCIEDAQVDATATGVRIVRQMIEGS